METINIYRLYDPLAIQQMQYKLEAAAIACPTAGCSFGYAVCSVLDNGFWTLENTLTELANGETKLKTIEEAVARAQIVMRDFDIAMQGGKPKRELNEAEKAFDWNTVHPKYHPPQLREGYQAPKLEDNGKPKFFEYANFIGGSSRSYQKDGKTYRYWRLVYGIQVKPSKEEDAVLVEDVEIVVEYWVTGFVKFISYYFLPVKEVREEKRIGISIGQDTKASVCYGFDRDINVLVPFMFSI